MLNALRIAITSATVAVGVYPLLAQVSAGGDLGVPIWLEKLTPAVAIGAALILLVWRVIPLQTQTTADSVKAVTAEQTKQMAAVLEAHSKQCSEENQRHDARIGSFEATIREIAAGAKEASNRQADALMRVVSHCPGPEA